MHKRIILSFLCCFLLFTTCTYNLTGGSTETSTKVASVLYNPGGSPAANATVKFYPINYNPRTSGLGKITAKVDSATTDANGNYNAKLDTGAYNILAEGDSGVAYQDSIVVVKNSTVNPPADTLKAPGGIRGVVRLQPGDDARKVFIIALGTNAFSSPEDAAGNFALADMAEGRYKIRIMSILDNYGVLDTSLEIRAGKSDSLADTIVLPYTGIPVPTGLKLSYDTLKQIVTLTWNKPTTGRTTAGYNIYRKNRDSTDLVKIKGGWKDTVYSDSTGVQDQTYEYRVAAADTNTTEGTKSAGDVTKIVPWVVLNDSIGEGIGTSNGQFTNLQSFTMDINGNFYTVDYGRHVVQVFSKTSSFIRAWGGLGSDSGKFNQPYDIAMDKYGYLYVADGNNNRIQKFDSLGNFISSWGSFGTGNGQFNIPCRITIFDTLVYVGQWNQPRIQRFTLKGLFLSAFGSSGQTLGTFKSSIHGLSADSVGNIYVFDRYSLQKFDAAGNFLEILFSFNDNQQNGFQGSAMDFSRNTLYITSMVLQEVVGYDLSGNQVSRFRINDIPSYVMVSNDRILVSIYNGYIYLFNRR